MATGANTYEWDNNVVNGLAFVPEVGTTQYTVTGTDINGCINSDEVFISVNANPIVLAGNIGAMFWANYIYLCLRSLKLSLE